METREFLKQRVELLKGFSDEHLEKLIDGSRAVSFESNQSLWLGSDTFRLCFEWNRGGIPR